MTDLELQKNIAEELEGFLKDDGIMMPLAAKFAKLNVYVQDLPLKGDEDEYDQKNYIVVMLGNQEADDECWTAEIHFSICIEDRDEDRSGNTNILYLMNEIYMHFIKKGIIGRHCRMEKAAHKILNLEAMYPYYEGDLVTYWKLPLPNEEGLEGFL